MKSQKGVTLISVAIYIVVMLAIVTVISRISTFFYKNVNNTTGQAGAYTEYTKFNNYMTKEINIKGNEVKSCQDTTDMNYIIFSSTQNQYSFVKADNAIYRNKARICKDVDECSITYDSNTRIISIYLKIRNIEYNLKYTVYR